LAQARECKPVDPSVNSPGGRNGWHDTTRDLWGRRQGSHDRALWAGGNCLKSCLATMLQAPIACVPDPTLHFRNPESWWEDYSLELAQKLNVRLEEIAAGSCPPLRRGLWIAVVSGNGGANHAIVAREHFVYHDPAAASRATCR